MNTAVTSKTLPVPDSEIAPQWSRGTKTTVTKLPAEGLYCIDKRNGAAT